ncbi:hypothetical protein [Mesorhizobium sp.]|uniref:hypothetical protein n=1 Tax=Mesorhizobium sp. TaxID=1871066 RepID=UPI0025C24346|nr:hypothetical protein [Mesorhizobium sp.]
MFGHRWLLFSSGRLLARHRLFANGLLAALFLVQRLIALGGSRLLLCGLRKRFGLRDRFAGGCRLFGRRLLGGRSLYLLILLALLLAQVVLAVVVVCRRDLFGRLLGGCCLDLLLVALLLARHDRLLVVCRSCLLSWLLGRCRFDLLLLVALLPARLLLFDGRCCLFGRRLFRLLLLLFGLALARLLFLLGSGLLGRRGFGLLLLLALLFLGLFRFSLLVLRAGLGRFALGAARLRQNQWRCGMLRGAENGTTLQRVRAQRRGCHQQADRRACQNPWLAFHLKFSLWGPIPAQTCIIRIGSGAWALAATKDD